MYLNTQTLERATERDIRAAFPNTSFPEPFQAPELYVVLFAAPQPTHDPVTQSVRETTPILTSKGHWEQQWKVVDLDPETVTENQAKAMQEKVKAFDSALTAHLDSVAQSKKYDNRITCMVRAGFAGPFQAEAQIFALWADECNAFAYDLLDKVQKGLKPIPESTKAFIEMLPEIKW